MLILNSGGTFNKRYNLLNGLLEVPYDNSAIENILQSVNYGYKLAGVVYKDSLEMDSNDRKQIADIIMQSNESDFIIVHGTDTMHITAEFLDTIFEDKRIILTGAMQPFSIDKIESSLNLGMAIGYMHAKTTPGIYIAMSGYIELWNIITKNQAIGKFELV